MPFYKLHTNNKKNKIYSLRVRMQCHKKALFSASFRKKDEPWKKQKHASMTVEAAMVLTLFLFAMLILMVPLKMINTHRILQAELESIGENICKYAYVPYSISAGDQKGVGDNKSEISNATKLFTEIASEIYITERLKKATKDIGVEHISAIWSDILSDGENVNLNVTYSIKIPFSVFGIASVKQSLTCHRRAWIGKSASSDKKNENGESAAEEMVYIGKNSTRYHRSPSCHYLSNKLICINFTDISSYRNTSGGKYTACAVCSGSISAGKIYIFAQGKHYHSSPDCRAITAYVQKVPLSQAAYLGACSYCGQ